MQKWFLLLLSTAITGIVQAQQDSTKWIVSFPISDYIITDTTNKNIRIVQVELPDESSVIPLQTIALLRGYNKANAKDTAVKGSGKCRLVKNRYCYFGITLKPGTATPKAGDLLYMRLPRPNGLFFGRLPRIAALCIRFTRVTEELMFDYWAIRKAWTADRETALLTDMLADIHYTAVEMRKKMPDANQPIAAGGFAGQPLFDAMEKSTIKDVQDFLDYVIARPLLYAGNDWKISEVFATWQHSGAPLVVSKR
jgi:hypothetical protein